MEQERRKDSLEILQKLLQIEEKVNGGLKDQFADLKQTQRLIWDKHDIEAKEFRNKTEKIWMEVLSRLDKLPCDNRLEVYKQLWFNIYSIWGVLGTVLLGVTISKIVG
jgi:hypothetical protein